MSCEVKRCVFVRNKSILTLNYSSPLSKILFPQWKNYHLNQDRNIHRSNTIYKLSFFTGGSVIMDYGLIFWSKSNSLKLKSLNSGLFLTNMQLFTSQDITDGLEWCGLLWFFISCLDTHSDGTHSLQRIHWWCNVTDVMLHFSKWRNKLIYILDVQRVSYVLANVIFWVNYSLTNKENVFINDNPALCKFGCMLMLLMDFASYSV